MTRLHGWPVPSTGRGNPDPGGALAEAVSAAFADAAEWDGGQQARQLALTGTVVHHREFQARAPPAARRPNP
jgi:hypothetical protein